MKKNLFVLIFALFIVQSCTIESSSKKEKGAKGEKEIPDGIRKSYHDNGKIRSEVSYKGGKKNGLAKDYYATGQLRLEMNYKDGEKDGESKMYYENGKLFRITPYKGGLIDGIQKKYRENGDLMSEAPFKLDKPGLGLKEYTLQNKLKEGYPEIKIKEINTLSLNNEFTLEISLSEKAKNVKFYLGQLVDGKYLSDGLYHITMVSPSKGIHKFLLPRGAFQMEKLNIITSFETLQDNVCIIQKPYNLAIDNR